MSSRVKIDKPESGCLALDTRTNTQVFLVEPLRENEDYWWIVEDASLDENDKGFFLANTDNLKNYYRYS